MGTRAERKDDFGCGFGFGVVEHSHNDVMVLPHHHHYPSPTSSSLCYGPAGVGDPMFSASSSQAYASSPGEMFSLASSASNPFFTTLSPSGEMGRNMSEKAGAGFSEAQWQELERQRNIYKYMMASVPIPSELLTPFSKNPSDVTVAKGASLKLGIASSGSNNMADLEPWRCKRTDGKKWRCSRNVIPDQKYCERHTHKSRPRSRKHVESSLHTDIRNTKNHTNQFAKTYPQFYGQTEAHQLSALSTTTLPSASSSYDRHSGLRWFMKEDDAITTLNPEIQEAVQLKMGSSTELKRGFDYDLNFREKEPLVDRSFGVLQSLLSLNQTQETRRFVVDGREQAEAMGSSLTLSMAGGAMEEAECTNQHQWVTHEGPSWLCSTTPGGPLAEALCLGASNNPSTSTTTTSSSS